MNVNLVPFLRCQYFGGHMSLPTRDHSKSQINNAGKQLVLLPPGTVENRVHEIINNWRSSHTLPLIVASEMLSDCANDITTDPLVARRLKRLESIRIKLTDSPNMQLARMQDLAGCRAVVPDVDSVDRLVTKIEKELVHERRLALVKIQDYIASPKPDGYRGVHLVFKYQAQTEDDKNIDGQLVEIQLRSAMQHAWATTVETVQTFTGKALKSKVKTADPNWLRFFALMSSVFAIAENRPSVPSTPASTTEQIKELRHIQANERILDCLSYWQETIRTHSTDFPSDINYFLLSLDYRGEAPDLTIRAYKRAELPKAELDFFESEKLAAINDSLNTVLVSVDSVRELKDAYPNYYSDTSDFVASAYALMRLVAP